MLIALLGASHERDCRAIIDARMTGVESHASRIAMRVRPTGLGRGAAELALQRIARPDDVGDREAQGDGYQAQPILPRVCAAWRRRSAECRRGNCGPGGVGGWLAFGRAGGFFRAAHHVLFPGRGSSPPDIRFGGRRGGRQCAADTDAGKRFSDSGMGWRMGTPARSLRLRRRWKGEGAPIRSSAMAPGPDTIGRRGGGPNAPV